MGAHFPQLLRWRSFIILIIERNLNLFSIIYNLKNEQLHLTKDGFHSPRNTTTISLPSPLSQLHDPTPSLPYHLISSSHHLQAADPSLPSNVSIDLNPRQPLGIRHIINTTGCFLGHMPCSSVPQSYRKGQRHNSCHKFWVAWKSEHDSGGWT